MWKVWYLIVLQKKFKGESSIHSHFHFPVNTANYRNLLIKWVHRQSRPSAGLAPYLFLVPWLCICGLLHLHPRGLSRPVMGIPLPSTLQKFNDLGFTNAFHTIQICRQLNSSERHGLVMILRRSAWSIFTSYDEMCGLAAMGRHRITVLGYTTRN